MFSFVSSALHRWHSGWRFPYFCNRDPDASQLMENLKENCRSLVRIRPRANHSDAQLILCNCVLFIRRACW
jgi:hypothetical protein